MGILLSAPPSTDGGIAGEVWGLGPGAESLGGLPGSSASGEAWALGWRLGQRWDGSAVSQCQGGRLLGELVGEFVLRGE